MHSKGHPQRSVYVVIQKEFTEIWEDDFKMHAHPIVIYEPGSIPKGVHHDLDAATSTYDVASTQRANKSFPLISDWMRPDLNYFYEKRIYHHLKDFDQVFLVGGGLGKWSGINSFLKYIDDYHPKFLNRIQHERRFRLTNFPYSVLFKIFKEMTKGVH